MTSFTWRVKFFHLTFNLVIKVSVGLEKQPLMSFSSCVLADLPGDTETDTTRTEGQNQRILCAGTDSLCCHLWSPICFVFTLSLDVSSFWLSPDVRLHMWERQDFVKLSSWTLQGFVRLQPTSNTSKPEERAKDRREKNKRQKRKEQKTEEKRRFQTT